MKQHGVRIVFDGILLVSIAGCGLPVGPPSLTAEVHVGEEAKTLILQRADLTKAEFVNVAKEYYLCESGNFNGTIVYYVIDFDKSTDCVSAFEQLSGMDHGSLTPWRPSEFAVVMDGPRFYWDNLGNAPWDLWSVTRGLVYENMRGEHQRLDYYALDLDKNRLYCYLESGGFSARVASPPLKK